ncbi:hypothetical protein T484DRAFT_1808883 [Baffinella frigidus]|nr:hypothetical protein T484DRAFT_1808883 [Cryptophyta sp. CCMP2293]
MQVLVLGYIVVQGKGEAHLSAAGALSGLLEAALPALFPDAAAEAFDKEKALPLDGALPSAKALGKRFAGLDAAGTDEAAGAWRRLLSASVLLLVSNLAEVTSPRDSLGYIAESAPASARAHDSIVRRTFLAMTGGGAAPRAFAAHIQQLLGTHARAGMQAFLADIWRGLPHAGPHGPERPGTWSRVHALYIAAALWEGAATRADSAGQRAKLLERDVAAVVPLLLATLTEPRAKLLEGDVAAVVPLLLATLTEPKRALRHAALTACRALRDLKYGEDGRVIKFPAAGADQPSACAADVVRLLSAVVGSAEEFEADAGFLSSFLASALPLDEVVAIDDDPLTP